MTFSADPNVGATLTVSGHLIPQVSLGLNALDGAASASVFLDVDASLGLTGSVANAASPQPCLSGNADINVGVGAQGSFFGLFDASAGQSLFDKNFPLFQVRSTQSGSSTVYVLCFLNIFSFLSTRQKCFSGNTNSTNSTSTQGSAPGATATSLIFLTSAASTTATNLIFLTSTASTTATNLIFLTSAASTTATDSASQTSAAGATATSGSKRHYDAPQAARHSARFGRSNLALTAKRDLSRL